jgi:hypothetical protein
MKLRNRCRLQVEQLEDRAVPAIVGGHLIGHNAINTTFTVTVTGVNFLTGNLGGGSGQVSFQGSLGNKGVLQKGKLSFSGMITGVDNVHHTVSFAGTLNITTKNGTVFTVDTGSVDTSALTFQDTGTILGGTRAFKGATGNFTANGAVNVISQSASGNILGTIIGGSLHHKKHHP